MSRVALITGVTGQDGACLAELLLAKGYVVHGVKRRSSSFNTGRIDHLYADPHEADGRFFLHHGDLTDATNLIRLVQETRPDEIYNLAAQSHVRVSFETPEYTANADALGTLRLLEALRILGRTDEVRFYQASTSELYGDAREAPQNENTPFRPRSPYAIAKLYAYWTTVNYREAYGVHASNGILFNHEGPTRGETFVTRKITRAVAAIATGRSWDSKAHFVTTARGRRVCRASGSTWAGSRNSVGRRGFRCGKGWKAPTVGSYAKATVSEELDGCEEMDEMDAGACLEAKPRLGYATQPTLWSETGAKPGDRGRRVACERVRCPRQSLI